MIIPSLVKSFAIVVCGIIGGILAFLLMLVAVGLLFVLIAWLTGDGDGSPGVMLLIAIMASFVTIPSGFLAASWSAERLLERHAQRRGFPIIRSRE